MEDKFFQWVRRGYETDNGDTSFCDFLLDAARSDVVEHHLWLPVANLQVEAPNADAHEAGERDTEWCHGLAEAEEDVADCGQIGAEPIGDSRE